MPNHTIVSVDFDVPLPKNYDPTFFDKMNAACRTLEYLIERDPEAVANKDYGPGAEAAAAEVISTLTSTPDGAEKAKKLFPELLNNTAAVMAVQTLLKEYAHDIIGNSAQLRQYVTNRLLLESDDPNPKVRLRALELLGKISDVGLFAERHEVTITHQSTDDLKEKLREKLAMLKSRTEGAPPPNIIDVTPENPNGA